MVGQLLQESDLLGASFFTHFLASGLVGDADADRYANARTHATAPPRSGTPVAMGWG